MIRFDQTPNPNAIKCILDTEVFGQIRSFRTSAEADGDPLARQLFQIGATSVLINGSWITVNKRSDVEWAVLKPKITAILKDFNPG